jgi:hypothetical protein
VVEHNEFSETLDPLLLLCLLAALCTLSTTALQLLIVRYYVHEILPLHS